MKISVVIPTMNGSRFLGPCLDALGATRLPAGVELETIVVDNGSTDDTAALLARRPAVKALFFSTPLGFARANNAAREAATGDVVCFLNNDTRVERGWVERPVEIFARDQHVAAVGSKLLYMHAYVPVRFSVPVHAEAALLAEGLKDKVRWSADRRAIYLPLPAPGIDAPLQIDPVVRVLSAKAGAEVSVGGGPARRIERVPFLVPVDRKSPTVRLIQNAGNSLNSRLEGEDVGAGVEDAPGAYDREEVVPAICGAALWARRSALDAVGWFPEYYNVYYEDVDLCLKLRSRGGLLVFCPASRVNHYHTGTNREHSPRFIENVAHSSLLFAGRYGAPAAFARTLLERLGHVRNELRHGSGWNAAAGTRGFLRALPDLRGPLGARLRASFNGSTSPAQLLQARRQPYVEAR